jgi:hypothetical protein
MFITLEFSAGRVLKIGLNNSENISKVLKNNNKKVDFKQRFVVFLAYFFVDKSVSVSL